MGHDDRLTERFEANRARLRGIAYRMLGSLSDADDAVQEAWLRFDRSDTSTVENLEAWLTTVVGRVCLDMLRARTSRREAPMAVPMAEPRVTQGVGANPEAEAVLADSVGVALLVVLNRLTPAERLAFVLHDLFGLPFAEVGPILERSPAAAKQLASRARRRVRGAPAPSGDGLARQRAIVDAFMHAVRAGDLEGLLAVLDPDAVLHIDAPARTDGVVRVDVPPHEVGQPREIRGASGWARQMLALSRGLGSAQVALIDGAVGIVFAPHGRMARVVTFAFANDRIVRVEGVGDPERLRTMHVGVL
ncbi:MAG: sigma-70 family RNA polymerase sigma factor [Alphaproteobacteria bacterium]